VELLSDKAASPEMPELDVVLAALLPCEQQPEIVGRPQQMPSACPIAGASVLQDIPQRQV